MKFTFNAKRQGILFASLLVLGSACGTDLDLRNRHKKKESGETNLTGKQIDELKDKVWKVIQDERRKKLNEYLTANQSGLDSFNKAPLSYSGTPAAILKVLPDIVPELWTDASVASFTGLFRSNPADSLYYGMSYVRPAADKPMMAQFTCAACHTGQVIGPDGKVQIMVGAPSTKFDINGYRTILGLTVTNPNFTPEKVLEAILKKPAGKLYGEDRQADENMDKYIFSQPGVAKFIVEDMFKTPLLEKGAFIQQSLGAISYHKDMRLLQSSPGKVEAFGFATLAFLPQEKDFKDALVSPEPMAMPLLLSRYLGANPSVADIMSVWKQSDRVAAQWDGNIKNRMIRNLGAELGVAGDAKVVNVANALATTPFVSGLPSPIYPFNVDLVKAIEGRLIYQKACASCHESEKFMGINEVGTEPGRATGLTVDARRVLVQNLKAGCGTTPECQAPDEDIIVPRQSNPGYLALPLAGLWARAPYLHNGSVPNIAQLLVPSTRAAAFKIGNLKYDEVNMGFVSNAEGKVLDTSIVGYGNQGHSDINVFNGGIDFASQPAKLKALIEYLKTL